MLVYQRVAVEQCRTHLCSFVVVLACTCLFRAYDCIIMYHDWKKKVSLYAKATCGTVMNECRQWTIMGNPCFVLVNGNDFFERNSPSRSLLHQFMIQLLFLFSGFLGYLKSPPWSSWKTKVPEEIMFLWNFVPFSMVYTMFKHNPKSWGVLQSSDNSDFTQKHVEIQAYLRNAWPSIWLHILWELTNWTQFGVSWRMAFLMADTQRTLANPQRKAELGEGLAPILTDGQLCHFMTPCLFPAQTCFFGHDQTKEGFGGCRNTYISNHDNNNNSNNKII